MYVIFCLFHQKMTKLSVKSRFFVSKIFIKYKSKSAENNFDKSGLSSIIFNLEFNELFIKKYFCERITQ